MGPWIILGAAALGAVYAFRGELGLAQLFARAPGQNRPRPTPTQKSQQEVQLNQRGGGSTTADVDLLRTVIDVQLPAFYGVIGCCKSWASARRLPDGRRDGGIEQHPPWDFYGSRCGCRPPTEGRPWWLPIFKADRDKGRGDQGGVVDVEYAPGTPGIPAPVEGGKRPVRGFARDGVGWVLTSASRNFHRIGGVTRQGGFPLLVFVSLDGWTAFRADTGRSVRESAVQLTYAGVPVRHDLNPWDVEPWTAYGDGTDDRPPGGRLWANAIWADENPAIPTDWIAPAVAQALVSKGYVQLPDGKVS